MKLRTRLFLWVGSLFIIGFVLSFFLEEHLVERHLKVAEGKLKKEIVALNEKKRLHIEEYLAALVGKAKAKIDALLGRIASYEPIRADFVPSSSNLQSQTWLKSASLMITNHWADFIQNVNQDQLASMIILNPEGLSDMVSFPLDNNIALIGVNSAKDPSKLEWNGPYIGVRLDIDFYRGEKPLQKAPIHENSEFYLFFEVEEILNFEEKDIHLNALNLSINLLEPFLDWIEIPTRHHFVESLLTEITNVKQKLLSNKDLIPTKQKWDQMTKSLQVLDVTDFEKSKKKSTLEKIGREELYLDTIDQEVTKQLISLDERYDQVGMIWGLTTLYSSGAKGFTPFGKQSPKGIVRIENNHKFAKGVLSKDVFYDRPLFNIKDCLGKFEIGKSLSLCDLNRMEVVLTPNREHVYFANTLYLVDPSTSKSDIGYLTVGIHAGDLLKELALSVHEVIAFVSSDAIIKFFGPDGNQLQDADWERLPITKILNEDSGLINVGDQEYYFLHMQPYKTMDFHFFTFTPKKQAFAFIDSLDKDVTQLIHTISYRMRILSVVALLIILFILHRIAKKVTEPIAKLAEVTKTVGEGRLDDIDLPEPDEDPKDEIYTLYHAFFQMVKGLQEKEKVRGILNKVVSLEIAEETLKGNVQLGGEEKFVTVLFADIRHFTKLTEKMDPQEVISLINNCMTKISHVIDEHGGVIDKYVGDEVMALFGAPVPKEDSTIQSIKSAVDMVASLKSWNEKRKEESLPPIEIGIGIHSGEVVAGNMGADNRLNYTVLGSNVNLASRLCSFAKEMEVLISESTYNANGVKETFDIEEMEPVELKGFTEKVKTYRVKGYLHPPSNNEK